MARLLDIDWNLDEDTEVSTGTIDIPDTKE